MEYAPGLFTPRQIVVRLSDAPAPGTPTPEPVAPRHATLYPLTLTDPDAGPVRSSRDGCLRGPLLGHVINPAIFFALWVLGGLGVCLALPRKKASPQLFGALIAGLAGGLLLIAMGYVARDHLPNLYFYIFSLVGLGSALRVITHPRPVYAALYFIMTVLASAGLFLILSAEFMAFALIIVYAGAILITYLFVIMLASQAPEEGEVEALASYDTQAREPIAATVVGFLLLAVLTTMLFRGTQQLPAPVAVAPNALLKEMPRKIDTVLRNHSLLQEGEKAFFVPARVYGSKDALPRPVIDIQSTTGAVRTLTQEEWPEELAVKNVEALGFNLLQDHPGSIEIAGVILLMAMLGAVVLSRKQVQIDEDAKMAQARMLAQDTLGGVDPGAGRPPLESSTAGARA